MGRARGVLWEAILERERLALAEASASHSR